MRKEEQKYLINPEIQARREKQRERKDSEKAK